MSLKSVFTAIEERFADDRVKFAGPDRIDDTDKPPRVRWVPLRAQRTPPTRAGGGPRDDGDIAVRSWVLELEFWGVTLTATEELADKFFAVCHDLGTHFTFPPEGTEDWNTGGVSPRGVICKTQFTMRVPIRRTVKPVVRPIVVPALKLNDTPV